MKDKYVKELIFASISNAEKRKKKQKNKIILKAVWYQSRDSIAHPILKLDIALFDLPYQFDAAKTVNNGKSNLGGFFKGYANPSMSQALSLSTSLYSASHYGMDRLFKVQNENNNTDFLNISLHALALIFFDVYISYIPGADGWLHEEFTGRL